jgi:hypothetical protein
MGDGGCERAGECEGPECDRTGIESRCSEFFDAVCCDAMDVVERGGGGVLG